MTAVAHTSPRPTTVELKRTEKVLRIAWEDGHLSVYPLHYLRGFCPCAHCQGHGQSEWTFNPVEDPSVQRIEEVGFYALGIAYDDGHDTGIYSFDILRELCPCERCQSEQGERHAMRKMPGQS